MDYDVAVIGSGFGGSVSALRLAEKGYRVAVLEQGNRVTPEDIEEGDRDVRRLNWLPGLGCGGYFSQDFFRHVTLVRGIGVGHVSVIKPYNVKKSMVALTAAIEYKGVSVVIAQQECALQIKGTKKAVGRPFTVSDRCKDHRVCINEVACPAFYVENSRVKIDAALCTGCSVCAQVCPEKAIIPLK